MGDDNTTEQQKKKRKSKWTTSYSNMTIRETEKRLGVRIELLAVISIETMLAEAQYRYEGGDATLMKTRKKVYHRIMEYLDTEGYPTEANPNFKEVSISDLIYATIAPIISSFRRITGRNSLRLEREREIISTDSATGDYEEFVMVGLVSAREEKFVFIVEAKRSSLGQAMKQCLLSMKDMRDNNGGGEVYGFVTTGRHWRMIRYDGTSFVSTVEFAVLFDIMGADKKTWMKDYSVVVDCMYCALSNGGIVVK